MPKELERKLKHRAEAMLKARKLRGKKGESRKEKINHFVYGTMNNMGVMHGNKRMM